MQTETTLPTKADLQAYLKGEMTWAEVEGMTWKEARAIAEIGCELAQAGRLEEARVIFEGLVAGNPKDAAARAALGTVYQKLGRLSDARNEYEAALLVDPTNVVARAARGELKLRAGDPSGAEDLIRTLALDPNQESGAAQRAEKLLRALAAAQPEKV